jgi:hypothetical protein
MTSRSTLMVKHPRERLRAVLVERTWELAGFIDDIELAELVEISSGGSKSQSATHVWRAKASVPALLAPHIDSDYFSWTAVVQWNEDDFGSRWRIEPHALKESLSCSADVALNEAMGGRATRVAIELGLHGLDGRRGVETIAYRIVMVNWQKLVEAAVRKLAEE